MVTKSRVHKHTQHSSHPHNIAKSVIRSDSRLSKHCFTVYSVFGILSSVLGIGFTILGIGYTI